MSDDEKAIRELVARWMEATKAGDVETVLSLMAEDAIFTVPWRAPFGKKLFATSMPAMAGMEFEGKYEIVELRIMGDWAWLRSWLRVSVTLPSGEVKRQAGFTLTILTKEDGRWFLKRDANCLSPEKS